MNDSDSMKRIMAKRKKMSEGGEVDNDSAELADSDSADFNDTELRDDLEFSLTGANSGDELGNDNEDSERKDTVSRIMRQRKMKQSNPKPA